MSNSPGTAAAPLRLLPWQREMCDFLRRHEPRAWAHFASPAARDRRADDARLELLQTAYPIDRASWPEWYAAAEQAAAALGLALPVALYQAQAGRGLAAVPAAMADESHVVLHGQPATRLPEGEFRALLAHALSHVLLWRVEDDLLPAEQVLQSLTGQPEAPPAYGISARRFALMTKVVCDRGALGVVGDAPPVIGLLARLEAERASHAAGAPASGDNPASFLLRAEEMYATAGASAAAVADRNAADRAENYLRAWALQLWASQGCAADDAIQAAIAGTPKLQELDAVGRQRAQEATRRLLSVLLARPELQTAAMLDHARLYFADFRPPERSYEDVSLAGELQGVDAGLRDYYCFVLVDFVSADRAAQSEALRAALHLATRLGLVERFAELVQEELGVRKKQLEKLEAEASLG
jgi:hypothetical protein